MYVQLIINGVIKDLWYFDHGDFPEAFSEMGHAERKYLWNKIITECRDKASAVIYQVPYEMFINIRPKIQPKDISDEEYAEFERTLEEKQNNHITKLKRRFV
jgi:hypothetical protein